MSIEACSPKHVCDVPDSHGYTHTIHSQRKWMIQFKMGEKRHLTKDTYSKQVYEGTFSFTCCQGLEWYTCCNDTPVRTVETLTAPKKRMCSFWGSDSLMVQITQSLQKKVGDPLQTWPYSSHMAQHDTSWCQPTKVKDLHLHKNLHRDTYSYCLYNCPSLETTRMPYCK